MIQSKPTTNEILAEVWTAIKSAPYLPWCQEKRDQLFVQLGYMGTHLESEEKKEKYLKYVDYLWVNYFQNGQFTFMDNTIFNYFYSMSDDITNNPVESKNYSLNSHFTKGRKTMASLCQTITDVKKKHQTERMYALKKSDKRYFRKRDPKRIQHFQNRRQIVLSFVNLPLQQQCQTLWSTMLAIGELSLTSANSNQ